MARSVVKTWIQFMWFGAIFLLIRPNGSDDNGIAIVDEFGKDLSTHLKNIYLVAKLKTFCGQAAFHNCIHTLREFEVCMTAMIPIWNWLPDAFSVTNLIYYIFAKGKICYKVVYVLEEIDIQPRGQFIRSRKKYLYENN